MSIAYQRGQFRAQIRMAIPGSTTTMARAVLPAVEVGSNHFFKKKN